MAAPVLTVVATLEPVAMQVDQLAIVPAAAKPAHPRPPCPSLPPPPPQPVTRAFLSHCPSSWGVERAEISADDVGPLMFRLYVVRQSIRHQSGLQLVGREETPVHSFLLPLADSDTWTDESLLKFVHRQVSEQLLLWLRDSTAVHALSSQILSGIAAMDWLDAERCFCLPAVMHLPVAFVMPVAMRIWGVKRVGQALSCSAHDVSLWLSDVCTFVPGKRILCLPPKAKTLELVTHKRQRR